MRRIGYTPGIMACAMLFVVLLAVAVTPAVATDLTYTPGQKIVITQPGTYVLKNDISNSNLLICIEIQASNVVFDGGGHTIDGVRGEGTAGIYVHGLSAALSGVTIRNLKVQDWYYGIYLHETKSSTIEAATLSGNTFTGAVAYKGATGNTIKNSIITGNLYGLIFSDGAAGGVISNNEIRQNDQGLYIYLSDGITVTGNRITDNTNTGIQLRASGNGSIYNNRFYNNLNVAFSGEPFKANTWSVTPGAAVWSPANIIGGPKIGGNYWGRPDNTGWSQANADLNVDGFIDDPFTIAEGNTDNFPLATYTGPTPTATPTPTVTETPTPPVGQQGPYRAVTLPARVEAENYDTGGENVAYHDVEAANLGKAYRTTEGVDVESAGGVTNVAYIRAGEWTEYTVNVPATGTYPVTFRVASPYAGRQIQVLVNGAPKATVSVPNSGSYTSWRSVTVPVALDVGAPVIRLAYPVSSMNLDWFEFGAATGGQNPTVTPTASTTVTPQAGQSPYNGPHALPGTVQAEDYDNGGLNVAYWDSTTGNKAVSTAGAVAYRPNEHVDAETVGGGSNIGWITDGEWTEYTVSVATAGTYTANFRVGSWETGSRQVRVSVDGVERATVNVPNTGSSTAYETVSTTLALPAGSPVIKLRFVGAKQNIDWFSVTGGPEPTQSVTPTVTPTVTATPTATVTPDPSGQAAYKPHNAPVRVEAEDYDEGGPGVAYSDTTVDNQGLAYRLVEGVDVEPTSGGFNIGYIKSGEWVEYTVNIPAAGTYPTTFRVGSWYASEGARSISVSIGGVTAKGTVNVPLTNADSAYQTVTVPLALDAGPQVIRLTFNGARQNIDWFEVGTGTGQTPTPSVTATPTPSVTATPTATPTPTPTPSTGIPGVRTIPGRIEAEMYDAGPSGAAYRDYNPVNNLVNLGNWKVRDPTGVDLYSSGSVVYVGSIESWEWMEYTVNVVEEGDYTVDFRACSWGTTSTPYPDKPGIVWDPTKRVIQLRVDSPTYDYVVPVTASGTAFQTGRLSSTIHLTPGTHELGVMFLGKNQNFDYMEFNRVA